MFKCCVCLLNREVITDSLWPQHHGRLNGCVFSPAFTHNIHNSLKSTSHTTVCVQNVWMELGQRGGKGGRINRWEASERRLVWQTGCLAGRSCPILTTQHGSWAAATVSNCSPRPNPKCSASDIFRPGWKMHPSGVKTWKAPSRDELTVGGRSNEQTS